MHMKVQWVEEVTGGEVDTLLLSFEGLNPGHFHGESFLMPAYAVLVLAMRQYVLMMIFGP